MRKDDEFDYSEYSIKNYRDSENTKGKATKKRKKKKHIVVKRVFLVLLLAIVIVAVWFVVRVQQNGGGMSGVAYTIMGSEKKETDNLEDLYVLCMGKSQNMTDTIMVVKYSPKTQQASMLSVPRDSFVGNNKDTATAWDKINALYQVSPQKTIDAVNRLTGLNIKYYLTVDTKALRDLVDAIGGVDFDVPIDMDYEDCTQDLYIHIKAGQQHLNGSQAEGVVRFRHNSDGTSYSYEYGDNDLGRMKTQREFIKTVINQTMKSTNITNISKLLDIAQKEVATNLPWEVISKYVPALVDFDTENLRTEALPGYAAYANKLSFFFVDETKTKKIVEEFFLSTVETKKEETDPNSIDANSTETNVTTTETTENKTPAKANSEVRIELINATGTTSKLTTAVSQLTNRGYKVVTKSTTNAIANTIIIDRKSNAAEVENAIKALLCTGTIKQGEDTGTIDFTIILGQDY